jgi:hypothetical protein
MRHNAGFSSETLKPVKPECETRNWKLEIHCLFLPWNTPGQPVHLPWHPFKCRQFIPAERDRVPATEERLLSAPGL